MAHGPTVTTRALGDTHNFGRRVSVRGARVHKPRTLLWEWLLLAPASPLRRALAALARDAGAPRAFAFLPSLRFYGGPAKRATSGGLVEALRLAPLGRLGKDERVELAVIVGRATALFSWLGLADLHWENLALGRDAEGHMVFGPLDVELILAALSLPTETKLIADADPEYASLCRHAAGLRRVLPYLGKPVPGELLATVAAAYHETLALLDRGRRSLAAAFRATPHVREAPIRVCLRSTADYGADPAGLWPPLLDAEVEQLARGDVPYFFRRLAEPGLHYFAEPTLRRHRTLPRRGDVPQLEPLLPLARDLAAPSRARLRTMGLFALVGAFDHGGLAGSYDAPGLSLSLRARTMELRPTGSDAMVAPRDLRRVVGSLYLPCTCGEARTALAPPARRCAFASS